MITAGKAMRAWCLALPVLAASSCDGAGAGACTEIGCDSSLQVLFAAGLVTGPYELVVDGENGTLTGHCAEPGSLEAQDNPDELSCDVNGFEVEGGSFANERGVIFVTIFDLSTDTTVVENREVQLESGEPITPNGPDCPPTCFDRTGKLL